MHMQIPFGYFLALLVLSLFILASILNIKEGKKATKDPGKFTRALGKFHVITSWIILLLAGLSVIIVVAWLVMFLIQNTNQLIGLA